MPSEPNKTTILFLAADPVDTGALRLGDEVTGLQKAFARAQNRDGYTLQSRWSVTIDDLALALQEFEDGPLILHFAGHMVQIQMNRNLDAIAGGATISAVAFNLVDWAKRSGYLTELNRLLQTEFRHLPPHRLAAAVSTVDDDTLRRQTQTLLVASNLPSPHVHCHLE